MGRGLSNSTKLILSAKDLGQEWQATKKPIWASHDFCNKLERSQWFKKNFISSNRSSSYCQNALNSTRNHPQATLPETIFFFVDEYGLDPIPAGGKYAYLNTQYLPHNHINHQDYNRLLANFYLVMIRHFMGKEWERALKLIYKKNRLSYRRLRTDKNKKLTGSNLVEFKMKLAGHNLFVQPLDSGN